MISSLLGKRFDRLGYLKEILSQSPIAYRLARGAFWSLIGGVGARVFTMLSSIIVARLLGREGYGELGIVQSTMGLFGVLAGFGLGSTATKYIAEHKYKDPAKAGRILSLTIVFSLASGLIIMIVCVAMSSWLARTTLNRPALDTLLEAGSLLLFVSTIGGVLSAALSGYEAFPQIAKINIIQGAAAPLTAIPLVWFFGVQGAIASLTIIAALGVLLCSGALKKESMRHNVSVAFNRSVWGEWTILWSFAFPAMASGLMVAPVTWISNLILVNQPNGYGEMGLFNVANQWRMIIIFLPGLITSAMLPILSESYGREDLADFKKTVSLFFHATYVVAMPLTVMVVTMGKPLAALFGNQFQDAAPIISILMISCFLTLIASTVGVALIGSGRMWISMLMNFGWAIVLIISSLILIPQFGGRGLAIALVISYLIHTFWVFAYVEVKLAPSSILNQWRLMLFSLILFLFSILIGMKEKNHYFFSIILITVSIVPLIQMFRLKILRFAKPKPIVADNQI